MKVAHTYLYLFVIVTALCVQCRSVGTTSSDTLTLRDNDETKEQSGESSRNYSVLYVISGVSVALGLAIGLLIGVLRQQVVLDNAAEAYSEQKKEGQNELGVSIGSGSVDGGVNLSKHEYDELVGFKEENKMLKSTYFAERKKHLDKIRELEHSLKSSDISATSVGFDSGSSPALSNKLFLSTPNRELKCFDASSTHDSRTPQSYYESWTDPSGARLFQLIDDPYLHAKAMKFYDHFIAPACESIDGANDPQSARLEIVKPGVLRQEGENWRITEKCKIRYL